MGTNGLNSQKFRKQVAELFDPQITEKHRHLLFPSNVFTSSDNGDSCVKNVQLTTSIDENGVTHKYSVVWTDKNSVCARKSASEMKIQEGLKTGKIVCDGPCGVEVSVVNVVQFGCDHVICDSCRRCQTSAALYDGSPSCCNKECLENARKDGLKLRSGRQLDSDISLASLISNQGPWEVLHINVSIIRKCENRVYRTQLDYEFPSQLRVAQLNSTLFSYKDTLSSANCYYSFRKPKSRQDLERISLTDTNLRFYHLVGYVPMSTGKMYVVIVGSGVRLA